MKTLHLLAITLSICGLVSGFQSACSTIACLGFSSITCSDYDHVKSCLNKQLNSCTASDTARRYSIQATIRAKAVQCGASSASVSMVTLLLAAAVAYFKS